MNSPRDPPRLLVPQEGGRGGKRKVEGEEVRERWEEEEEERERWREEEVWERWEKEEEERKERTKGGGGEARGSVDEDEGMSV